MNNPDRLITVTHNGRTKTGSIAIEAEQDAAFRGLDLEAELREAWKVKIDAEIAEEARLAGRPTWDEYWMKMAYEASSRSTDQSTHAGTIIVRQDNSVLTTGYNGPVRGEENAPQTRPEKYLHFEHSERNAIYIAAKHGLATNGCKLYVNFLPCADCARAIVQSGIVEVIVHKEGQEAFAGETVDCNVWDDSHAATMRIFAYEEGYGPTKVEKSILRWFSGEVGGKGFFRGKEFDL